MTYGKGCSWIATPPQGRKDVKTEVDDPPRMAEGRETKFLPW